MFASLPSPSSNAIEIGPFDLRAYGVMIALGVFAAVWLSTRRWERQGGDPAVIQQLALWAIPSGVVGARLYHVITDFDRFRGNYGEIPQIWHGGLGVWGAVAGGALGVLYVARRDGLDIAGLLEATAPAIPLAQAIGRFGNWFNQELFGKPTDVPWALEIDLAHRPSEYLDRATFHPTFLYEMLWNLGIVAVIVWVVPRVLPRLQRGASFAVYVFLYTVGRLWIELLRIDPATRVLGARVNVWVSILVGLVALSFVLRGLGRRVDAPAEVT
jgi:prolipoprotein diacylglyceryl transferase